MTGSSKSGLNLCVVASTVAVAFAPYIFGMSLAFTSPAIDTMQDSVKIDGKHIPAPSNLVVFDTAQGSLYGSCINIGALLGALLGGTLSDRFGRKKAILMQTPIYALAFALPGLVDSYVILLIARFIQGIGIGMCTSTVPTYINEIAPTSLRGAFGTIFQLTLTIGIMLTNLLGAFVFVAESDSDTTGHKFCQWKLLSLFGLVPAILLLIGTIFIPESPRWYATQKRIEEATENLRKLRAAPATDQGRSAAARRTSVQDMHLEPSPVAQELAEMTQEGGQGSESGSFKESVMAIRHHKRSFGIAVCLMVIQQLSGVNAVIFYQGPIFLSAGMDNATELAFYVMLVQVVATAVSVPLMDTAGRKTLLLLACAGMLVCCIGMIIFFGNNSPAWLALVSSFGYITFFSLGLGPIPWLMMGELLDNKIRGVASSICACINWFFSFLITLTLPMFKDAMQEIFIFYAACLLLGAAYVACRVPETKNKTLQQIQDELNPPPMASTAA